MTELLRLGFGGCTLEAAVPEESPVQSVDDLDGARVATSFPRLARALLPESIELVDVHGSVELAPRLGLADAIVDLVSSGSTLRTNGLRSVGAAARLGGGADRAAASRARTRCSSPPSSAASSTRAARAT